MLIKKPVAQGDIVSIKLSNGEEIIARMEEDAADYVRLSKPKSVTLGAQGLGMIPFMFLADDDTISIKQQHILVIAPSKKDAADQYLQGTTGIALA
jgi:hypothetical protein